jgi:hypothetical protein
MSARPSRLLFKLAWLSLGLSVVFFGPIAAIAWVFELDTAAAVALGLVPLVPAAAVLSGLLVRALEALFRDR